MKIKKKIARRVLFQIYVWQPHPPSKMAGVAKNRKSLNDKNGPVLRYNHLKFELIMRCLTNISVCFSNKIVVIFNQYAVSFIFTKMHMQISLTETIYQK
jgi:hypothetical protein